MFFLSLYFLCCNCFSGKEKSTDSISSDTIFTTLVTISIFILGYIANKLYENFKEDGRLSELKKYYLGLLEMIKTPTQKQINAFIEFSKQLKDKANRDYTPIQVSSFSFENIMKVNHADLYKIFVYNEKGNTDDKTKSFQKFQDGIIFLNKMAEIYEDAFKSFFSSFREHENLWQQHIGEIRKAYDWMANEHRKQNMRIGQDPFFDGFHQLYTQWVTLQGVNFRDRNIAIKNFIDPFLIFCRQFTGDDRIIPLFDAITGCQNAFQNIEKAKYFYRKFYVTKARKMLHSLLEIEKLTLHYKSSN